MHHPRWSLGAHRTEVAVAPLCDAVVTGGVDLSLSAHDHDYGRVARRPEAGNDDPAGVRHFVVGTGRKSFYATHATIRSESWKIVTDHFGVLDLWLTDGGYSWRFANAAGDIVDQNTLAALWTSRKPEPPHPHRSFASARLSPTTAPRKMGAIIEHWPHRPYALAYLGRSPAPIARADRQRPLPRCLNYQLGNSGPAPPRSCLTPWGGPAEDNRSRGFSVDAAVPVPSG